MITVTSNRKRRVTKLGLVVMQSAILFMGCLMATTQARAQTVWCAYNANGYDNPGPPDYHIQMYFSPQTLPSPGYGCVHYYSGTNYQINWTMSQSSEDFLPGLGKFNWNVPVNSANTSAQAYHHHQLGTSSGRAYFGLYGKMVTTGGAASTEWYIIDDWAGSPQPWSAGKLGPMLKKIPINGVYYDVYQVLEGPNNSIQQWWSVREQATTSGWIPYVQHFLAWETLNHAGVANMPTNDVIGDTYFAVEVNEIGSGTLTTYSMDMSSYPPN